jgi:hypothetical protein
MESLTNDFQLLVGMACIGGATVWIALGMAFFLTELWAAIFGKVDAGKLKEE